MNYSVDVVCGQLRKYRKALGFTQEQLSEKMKFAVNTYTHIESGHSYPSLKFLMAFSTVTNIPIACLVCADIEPASEIERIRVAALDDEKLMQVCDVFSTLA